MVGSGRDLSSPLISLCSRSAVTVARGAGLRAALRALPCPSRPEDKGGETRGSFCECLPATRTSPLCLCLWPAAGAWQPPGSPWVGPGRMGWDGPGGHRARPSLGGGLTLLVGSLRKCGPDRPGRGADGKNRSGCGQ